MSKLCRSFSILFAVSWIWCIILCGADPIKNSSRDVTISSVKQGSSSRTLRSRGGVRALKSIAKPTTKPTKNPSSSPTSSPTSSPSSSPTANPTTAPTTSMPTLTPTASPTKASPTIFPTLSPTTVKPVANSRPPVVPATPKPTSTDSPIAPVDTLPPTMKPTEIISVPLQKFVVVLVTSDSNVSIDSSALLDQTENYLDKALPNVLSTELKLVSNGRNLAEQENSYSISGTARYSSTDKIPSMIELWRDQEELLKEPTYLQTLQDNVNPNIVQTIYTTNDNNGDNNSNPVSSPTIDTGDNNNSDPNGNTDTNNENTDESTTNIHLIGGIVIVGGLAAVFTVCAYGFVRYRRNKNSSKENEKSASTLYDADEKEDTFDDNEEPSVFTDTSTYNPKSGTSMGFQRTGESVRSDAFSLDGEENFSPNQGQILLNQVMAMSSYSAESGAKFIWSADDNDNYKHMVVQRAVSSSCSSADSSGAESDGDDTGTAFSYSKACAQSVISHGSHTNTISPSVYSPKSPIATVNEEDEDVDSIFDGIEVIMNDRYENIYNSNDAVDYDASTHNSSLISENPTPLQPLDSHSTPKVLETEQMVTDNNGDTQEQELDTSHDISSPFIHLNAETRESKKETPPVFNENEKSQVNLEDDQELIQALDRISVIENDSPMYDEKPTNFMNQLEQYVLEEESSGIAKKKMSFPFRSKNKKKTSTHQAKDEEEYDDSIEPVFGNSKRDSYALNNSIDQLSRPPKPVDDTRLNGNAKSSSSRNLMDTRPLGNSSVNKSISSSPNRLTRTVEDDGGFSTSPKPPLRAASTHRRALTRDNSRYRNERIGGSRSSRTPSMGRPQTEAPSTAAYNQSYNSNDDLYRQKTPERRRPTQHSTLSPTAGAATARRNRLARRNETEDETSDQPRPRGASVNAAELRKNRLARQQALSNSSSFRISKQNRY